MKKTIILFLLVMANGFAQNLNQYKYALVPSKFSFLKEDNMYNLNQLTKMYLQKYGFEAYTNNEAAPDDFVNSNCNKIFIDVVNNSNMFTTKSSVVIKDCKNNILATSKEGTSRDKEFKVAYNLALREAFDSFNELKGHKYHPSEISLEKIEAPATTKIFNETPEILANELQPKIEVAQNQLNVKKYTAISTVNGYNLVAVASEYKIFQIFKTSSKEIFIAKRDAVSGVLIRNNNNWYFEYYEQEKLITEMVSVKF